ncbi:unnamed protein product [Notodromas monacha]|uniref:Uncharacterized protein n=1 Tax=Notodromas monacha TaxID=399045 RepID=A0A7R9GD44_9CRUS|nr:unnamed protein product [Notodromas monacha]CAG0916771.1 unnamed protein product [Notodromas monacha]
MEKGTSDDIGKLLCLGGFFPCTFRRLLRVSWAVADVVAMRAGGTRECSDLSRQDGVSIVEADVGDAAQCSHPPNFYVFHGALHEHSHGRGIWKERVNNLLLSGLLVFVPQGVTSIILSLNDRKLPKYQEVDEPLKFESKQV